MSSKEAYWWLVQIFYLKFLNYFCNWEYYQKLKKKDFKLKFDINISVWNDSCVKHSFNSTRLFEKSQDICFSKSDLKVKWGSFKQFKDI